MEQIREYPFTVDEVNRILNARFNGESLQAVADQFNTSRIVIRQLESNYMKRLQGETNE